MTTDPSHPPKSLHNPAPKPHQQLARGGTPWRRRLTAWQWLLVAVIGLSGLGLGGYLVYLNLPAVSVRIVAMQAGIQANLPGYQPDGYTLDRSIKTHDGRVSLTFRYRGGGDSTWYTISQQKSSWDSAAVKESLTRQHQTITTILINGLTVYRTDQLTTWVNGGILYHISGPAPLSRQQVQRIIASL